MAMSSSCGRRVELLDSILDTAQAVDSALDGLWSAAGVAVWGHLVANLSVDFAYERAEGAQHLGLAHVTTLLSDALGALLVYGAVHA